MIGTEIDKEACLIERFPYLHDVAKVGIGYGFFSLNRGTHPSGQLLNIFYHVVYPPLLVALVRRRGIDFCGDAHHASDVARFGLGAAHAAEPGGHKELSSRAGTVLIVHPHRV